MNGKLLIHMTVIEMSSPMIILSNRALSSSLLLSQLSLWTIKFSASFLRYGAWHKELWRTTLSCCLFQSDNFLFLVILGNELKTLCFVGRCSTACAILSALFSLVILKIGSYCTQAGLNYDHPILSGPSFVRHMHATTSFCYIEMGSHGLFAWSGLELDPPNLSLPTSLDYRYEPLMPDLL